MSAQYAFAPRDDDAIIRHRLLTRVSVTRGEPPMRRLVKKLMALAAEAARSGDAEEPEDEEEEGGAEKKSARGVAECDRAAKAFLLELAALEQPLLKTRAVVAANVRDQQRFHEMQEEVAQQMLAAQDEIVYLKARLGAARERRQQEEECELVRQQITQHPPRDELEAAIAALQHEVAALERENATAAGMLELRKKQFSLLLHTVDELQGTLEDEDNDLTTSNLQQLQGAMR